MPERKDDYLEALSSKFQNLSVEIVNFDNGATPESMQAYILVSGLTKTMLKDKGLTALDLGNYIYRKFGLMYEMTPEYHRTEEAKNSLAFYISKKTFAKMPHLQEWLVNSYNKSHEETVKRPESALYRGQRFLISKAE